MVAFHSLVQLAKPWQFPMLDYSTMCAGEVLQCSTKIHARYWDTRHWRNKEVGWPKKRAHALLTAGFKDWRCKVGNPKYPSRV